MAEIAPFTALRYDLDRVGGAERVIAPPYDVIGEGERLDLEARHPQNVVRLELPRGTEETRYLEAARLLGSWTAEGILRADPGPALYVYEQQFVWPPAEDRLYTRRGFLAAVRLEPFDRRVVLPHERTLSGPKEDRKRLMRATRTQISPIFGLYRDPLGISAIELGPVTAAAPELDVRTADGVRHRMWVLADPERAGRLVDLLRERQILIADGHHRYETLLALRDELRPAGAAAGSAAADFGMMFLARAEDPGLLVLPTHRLVKDLPGFDLRALRAAAAPAFDVMTGDEVTAPEIEQRLRREAETRRAVFAVRVPGERETTWLALKPIVDLSALGPPALRGLDVTVLHGILLGPLLRIDAAAMERQAFLSYEHDTAQAVSRVATGEVQAGFFMNATRVEQVLAACEAGFVLPQKSTYFQPKLATGLVMYRLDGGAAPGRAGPQP